MQGSGRGCESRMREQGERERCGRDQPSHPEGQQHVVRQEAYGPFEEFPNRSLRMDAREGSVMKASEAEVLNFGFGVSVFG